MRFCTKEVDMTASDLKNSARSFLKKNVVMIIAFVAAAITCFFVPFDKEYAGYFDLKTLTCLFCTLAVVCALKDVDFFYVLAQRTVLLFRNARATVLALVFVTFFGSMLIANDMALITFLPLGYFVLSSTGKEKYEAFTFVMQNIAANLGGMLTPFGNPQNLYLYSKFSIPTSEFVSVMAIPFAVSAVLITACCLIFVKREPLELSAPKEKLNVPRTVFYLLLFAYSIIIVFRVVPFWTGLIVIPVALLITDPKALLKVDYPLLATFVFFFIFAGNMSRIDPVREFLSSLLQKNTLLVSVSSCQFISNVPTAVLLSRFTDNYRDLLVGVNIGGTGTLIASLASLITLREYSARYPEKTLKYIGVFSAFNFSFLFILTGIMLLVK